MGFSGFYKDSFNTGIFVGENTNKGIKKRSNLSLLSHSAIVGVFTNSSLHPRLFFQPQNSWSKKKNQVRIFAISKTPFTVEFLLVKTPTKAYLTT
jgi:hypothetical protein